MTTDPLSQVSTRVTPQSEAAAPNQVQNLAGGYTFEVDDLKRLRRFLLIGTEGGTFYASQGDLTKDAAKTVLTLCRERPSNVLDEVLDVSLEGRAPRQHATLFTLAAVAALGDEDARRRALDDVLPQVARTGYHLFLFARYVEQFRGWGRTLRRGVANWYLKRDLDDLAYQVVKYRQREGWSHRDLLRLAHPRAGDADHARRALFEWVCRGTPGVGLPSVVEGFVRAQHVASPSHLPELIIAHRLSWEMLPPAVLNDRNVWEALLYNGLPQTALLRQLPRLTRLGVLDDLSGSYTTRVATQLQDPERLRTARVHPLNVLVALRTYASGHGDKSSQTWEPSRTIVDALDAAFYAAYGAVRPAGIRLMLTLDVSGSMDWKTVGGLPITPREASAAIALVTAATEERYDIRGFTSDTRSYRSSTFERVPISPRSRLDDAIAITRRLRMGATDCAIPMMYAIEHGLEVDAFVIYTDNETWSGTIHPHQALRRYRERSGIDARLVVIGMTATKFTIADPSDPGMLDVVGFDTAVPNLISDFATGRL